MSERDQIAWTDESLQLIMDALVGCLVKDVWEVDDPRRERAKRLTRFVHELIQLRASVPV